MKKFIKALLASVLSMSVVSMSLSTVFDVMAESNDTQESASEDGQPPEMPSGAEAPEKPDGEGGPEGGMGEPPGGAGGMPSGGGSAVTEWTAVNEFTEDTEETDGTYESTGTDENAVLVSGGSTVLNNPTVTRISEDSSGGDNSSFYGVGASVLATGGTAYINGGTITSEANGAAGAFAYSDGVVYIQNTEISTSGNTAGGIHAAGGGTVYAYDLSVETQGESSAAIRSDRGGGTMVVDGGTYTSNGTGSPAVYVTADITVNNAELTANNSEGICIEGLNTLRLFDCTLTSSMPDQSQNDHTWSVILYQSMSGDSEIGNSAFYMTGGALISENGGLFYSTNTESEFYLENVEITAADDCEYFLRVSGNANQRGWGTTGQNGADTRFTAVNQQMNGNVIYDSISQLDFYMQNGSVLTGAVIDDESYAGEGGDGYASVYIDSSSSWIVTGDSTVTNLYNEGLISDREGNTVTVIGTDGTVYTEGTSEYTITVGTYQTEADFSGATQGISYDNYSVEKPAVFAETAESETAEPAETAEAEETAQTAETIENDSEKNSSTGLLAAAAAAAACAAVFLLKKKK